MSDMTISAVMRRLQAAEEKEGRAGFLDPRSRRPAVPHSLRSSFRDWVAERTSYPRELAEMATGGMTLTETHEAVQNKIGKKPKRRENSPGVALKFPIENGLTVSVTANRKVNYHEILEAIQQAKDEVQHRINNNVQLY